MKILSLSIIVSVVICISSPALAANIGGPIRPLGHLKYAVGVEDKFVFKREMEEGGTFSDGTTMTEFEINEMNQAYVKVAVGILNYFNSYTKLGIAKIKEAEIDASDGTKKEIETDDIGLFCGIGITGTYEFGDGWLIGGDIEYNASWHDISELEIDGVPVTGLSGELENQQGQVAIFGGKRLDISENIRITPYVGGAYSYFNNKTDGDITYIWNETPYSINYDLDGDEKWGILVGVVTKMSESVDLSVEGEFMAETAVTVAGVVRF